MSLSLTTIISTDDTRGLVGMELSDMADAGLTPGDTVRLVAGSESFARVVPKAIAKGHAMLDQTTAGNCRCPDGAVVELTPVSLGRLDHVLMRSKDPVRLPPADLQDAFFDMALSPGDTLRLPDGTAGGVEIVSVSPEPAGLVGEQTRILLENQTASETGYEDIGGLSSQIAQVHEMISAPLHRPDLFRKLGVRAPRGVLFSGPPGSGKTLLARTVAARTKASFFQIDGPELLSKHYGESEAALRRVFQAASKAEPAIIFIDELDSLAPARAGLSGEKQVERRVVAQLLTLMDGMADRGRVVVMAATNLPDSIDPALRRPGRFDREIFFDPPNETDRKQILATHLRNAPLAKDTDLDQIARAAQGYVGADLAALAQEAAMAALSRSVSMAGGESDVDAATLQVTQADLEAGLNRTGPSLLRATPSDAAPLNWDDIGGLEAVKAELRQAVEWPKAHPDTMQKLGLATPRGILLTGPPGSGKTLLARALCGQTGMNFVPVRAPDLVSQFLGEAEKAVARLFTTARQAAPCLLFFDELDALAPRRGGGDSVFDRIVAQLLVEIDGISPSSEVTVLAATNRASAIDPALLRAGRFDRIIEVPLPQAAERAAILRVHTKNRPLAKDVTIEDFVEPTKGASGADLRALVDRAAWIAFERAATKSGSAEIQGSDFAAALPGLSAHWSAQSQDFIRPMEAAQ